MGEQVISLAAKGEIEEIGGKARNLMDLMAAGFPVPEGWVVSTSAYEQFLDRNGLRGRVSEALQDLDLKDAVEFDDTVKMVENSAHLTGTSASPGVATGPVRVVDSIEQLSEVREGEILVTSNTDPGWTAVFSKIAGLITETGGILSHGAVVSREYGIPAVTAVKGATKIFITGQRITLDGNEGLIYIREG